MNVRIIKVICIFQTLLAVFFTGCSKKTYSAGGESSFIPVKSEKLIYLGSVNPNPAIMSNHMHFFAAEKLIPTGEQHLDNDEYLNYMRVNQKEVMSKMGSSEYPHALMCAALLKYIQWKNTDK